jgi:hypothetical protein
MKTKREMPLLEALDEIASEVQQLKREGSARLNGHEIKMDDPVMLEIEKESGKKGAELEFEIKWPVKKARGKAAASLSADGAPKRRIRRRYLALGALAALGAGALLVARRRRSSDEDEEDDE